MKRLRPRASILAPLVALGVGLAPVPPALAQADAGRCADGRALSHTFDSGAAWSLCARIDDRHGLELVNLAYRAPGDRERPVLRSLHLAQILVHWHDAPTPERRIAGDESDAAGLGGPASVALGPESCAGETTPLAVRGEERPRLCARERASGLLAKYDGRAALQGEEWELFAVARQGVLLWRTGVTLAEDGSVAPSLALSGRLVRTSDDPRFAAPTGTEGEHVVGAALHATWRLAFALDTPAPDRVEEFDFPLESGVGNRRPMRVRPLVDESFRRVERERFRGWRVVDGDSGSGYYLDPLDSALAWNSPGDDWARFDLAVTRVADCERLASGNDPANGRGPGDADGSAVGAATASGPDTVCGTGLDAFVDGEPLAGVDPVLWHSRTRNRVPRREDLPFLSSVAVDMRIVPFDWTDASPFEVAE